jgi:hypothetical protein
MPCVFSAQNMEKSMPGTAVIQYAVPALSNGWSTEERASVVL